MIVYTAGYIGRTLEELQHIAEEREATIVDIRLMPSSKNPGWDWQSVSQFFGPRYRHIRNLGNMNYADAGELPIQIKDLPNGIKELSVIEAPAVILLCACRLPDGCHRAVVGKALAEEGFTVKELTGDDWAEAKEATGPQMGFSFG